MPEINDPQLLKLIIYLGAVLITFLITVIGFVAKWAFSSVIDKMDEFLEEVRKLTDTTSAHEGRLNGHDEKCETATKRLDSHSKAINEIGLSVAKCQSKHSSHVPA